MSGIKTMNIVSVSGGKDSTALLLLAIERKTENLEAVFADTGNEHSITYDYVSYLNDEVFPIRTIRADFSEQITKKKQFVLAKWTEKGVPQDTIERAAAALVPSGNPFLDLCLWKGRFPSTMARFCSEELKRNPIIEQVYMPYLEDGTSVISWQGVRRDESASRKNLPEKELVGTFKNGATLTNYRPILDWTAKDCFAQHLEHNIKYNPLYAMGMGRVGCMPCIHCRKNELFEIGRRFPEEIDRIRQWEDIVKQASKINKATFFSKTGVSNEEAAKHTIDVVVEWSKTKHGGKEYDMDKIN